MKRTINDYRIPEEFDPLHSDLCLVEWCENCQAYHVTSCDALACGQCVIRDFCDECEQCERCCECNDLSNKSDEKLFREAITTTLSILVSIGYHVVVMSASFSAS